MPYPISLDQNQKQTEKQIQRLMMTPEMQQAIHFLQLPLMELSQVIQEEMGMNPVLEFEEEEGESIEPSDESEEIPEKEMEFDEHQFDILRQLDEDFRDVLNEGGQFLPRRSRDDDKKKTFLENSIQDEPKLVDQLTSEAREAFNDPNDLKVAEILIGYVDREGLITTPLEEIATAFALDLDQIKKVIAVIKTFEPLGVGSQNVQEVLLTQLKAQGKQDSLAYKLIEKHFDDLLHNRLPVIKKKLNIPLKEIQDVIKNEISHLDLHPASSFSEGQVEALIPDIRLKADNDKFVADINEDYLQPLRLNRKYLKMLDDPAVQKETKDFIKSKILSAKWLLRNLKQRSDTLIKVANFLADYQHNFFKSPTGQLKPLVMKTVAESLNLHESTIARAVSHKYLETPRGLLPFRYFFSNAFTNDLGKDVSSTTVRDLVKQMIENEDKKKPISDELISRKIQGLGVKCARRTVAKYRNDLKFGNTQERRQF